jgi:hypothetical protein
LDEVAERQAVTDVSARDMDDKPELGQYERSGSFEIVVLTEADGKGALLLGAQHRDGVDRLHVMVEAADRAGQDQILGSAG